MKVLESLKCLINTFFRRLSHCCKIHVCRETLYKDEVKYAALICKNNVRQSAILAYGNNTSISLHRLHILGHLVLSTKKRHRVRCRLGVKNYFLSWKKESTVSILKIKRKADIQRNVEFNKMMSLNMKWRRLHWEEIKMNFQWTSVLRKEMKRKQLKNSKKIRENQMT